MATLEDRQALRGKRRFKYGQDRGKIIASKSHLPEISFGVSDGEPGPKWDAAVRRLKRCMGYSESSANERYKSGPYKGHCTINDAFIARLYRPFDKRYTTPDMDKRGAAYRKKLRDDHAKRVKKAAEERKKGGVGKAALAAAATKVGKHETGNNDAAWLREMEAQLPHNRLDWMIPGNPYCGFGCIWSYWKGAHLLLPDGTVYTPNICPWGGKKLGQAKFTRVSPENAKPGALVVFDWSPGSGADHVALARGPMRGGVIPTREFNTSPTNAGSQSNGGGVYDRTRTRGNILCVINVSV